MKKFVSQNIFIPNLSKSSGEKDSDGHSLNKNIGFDTTKKVLRN